VQREGDVYVHSRCQPQSNGDVCPADSNLDSTDPDSPFGHPDRAAYRDGGGDRTGAHGHAHRRRATTNCNAHDQAGLL
jgi:hypothetical protein